MGRQDFESETLIAHPLRAQPNAAHDATKDTYIAHTLSAERFDASEDGTGRGTPLVPVAFLANQITSPTNMSDPVPGDPCCTLSRSDNSPIIAFSSKDHGADAQASVSPTLRAMGHKDSHPNSGGQIAVAYDLRGREGGAQFEGPHDTANLRAAGGGSSRSYIAASAVRRLTPRECERLQGFDDDYTLIPTGKRNWSRERDAMRDYFRTAHPDMSDEELIRLAADGPRYKALGNSKATKVVCWIGIRIDQQLRRAA